MLNIRSFALACSKWFIHMLNPCEPTWAEDKLTLRQTHDTRKLKQSAMRKFLKVHYTNFNAFEVKVPFQVKALYHYLT